VHHGGKCHAGGDAGAGSDSAVTWEDRKTQKACLERYRVASAEIIAVFHEVAPDAIVEKASIDEAYLDVTSIVDAHLRASLLTLLTPAHLRFNR
jgi:type IV secretory pathway TrbF-like protein